MSFFIKGSLNTTHIYYSGVTDENIPQRILKQT